MGAKEIGTFLTYLATERKIAASTQNQALYALPFLYKKALNQEIGWITDVERAKRSQRLPVVFTKEETQAGLGHLWEEKWLMASLLYGSGLRLMECVRLRVKDRDFAQQQTMVRDGKGGKDRVTTLPHLLV